MSTILKVRSLRRHDDSIAADVKEGYVFFTVSAESDGKSFDVKKRVRIDKAEKMLSKFMSKLQPILEERYKEIRYFVADKTPPDDFSLEVLNSAAVEEKMYLMLEEVGSFVKTGRKDVLVTDNVVL